MWNSCEALSVDEKSINNVFFTKGLFKILSEEKVLVEPRVFALLQNQQIVIAIDKTLVLFENENQVEWNFINFTSNIDCMIVSESGNIVICALSDGNIHGIYIKGVALFDIMIQPEDVCLDRTFVGIQYFENSYYIMCTTGILYRIHSIDEAKVGTLEEDIPENMDETILSNVGLDRLYNKKYDENFIRFALIPCSYINDGYILMAANKQRIYFINEAHDNRIDIPVTMGEIKKIVCFDMKIVCLDSNGTLFEICPYTKLIFSLSSEENHIYIEDFVHLENDSDKIDLLILNKINEKYFIRIVEFPGMKCTFELETDKSWLIQPRRSLNMYYLTANNNNTQVTQEIEMKVISEVQPLQRFHKLIKMGKLELAEEFAKQFGISIQPILKEKSRKIVVEIGQSEIPQNELEVKMQQLMDLINQIEDKHFLVSLQRADIPDRKMMGRLLEFLLKNLDNTEFKDDIDDINERIIRLDTLRIIDPYDCDLMWQDFVFNRNIMSVFKEMIKNDILNSAIVFTRHPAKIIPLITKQNINSLLEMISSSTPPFQIITWLKHFVPSILNLKPNLMSNLVDWCLGQTQNLETFDMWPEIGFEFINDVYGVFQDFIASYFDILPQSEYNMEKLKFFIEILKDLTTLKTTYQLNLSLRDYTTDTIENITFNLLKKVQLSNLESLIDNFVYPQFNSKGLSPLPVIVRYVKFLTANRKNIPSWQIRAVTSLNLIHNEENKLECVQLVLRLASVPFSDIIRSLLKYGSTNHPLSADILALFKCEKIKLIKVKYGWPADSQDDYFKLICRIIKLNLPELIDDVTCVVRLIPNIQIKANFYCVTELAGRGEIEKAIQFIDSLEPSPKSDCLEMVLNSFLDELETNHIDASENVIEFLKLLTYRMADSERAKLRVNAIENLLTLRKILNMNSITLEMMITVQDKIGMLQLGLENLIENIKSNQEIENCFGFLCKKIILMTSLLALDPMIVYLEVAKSLNNIYISANIGLMVMELCTIDQLNLEYALEFVLFVLAQQIQFSEDAGNANAEDPLIYHILKEILTHLLSLDDNLMYYSDIGELLQWISIGAQVYMRDMIAGQIEKIRKVVNTEIRTLLSPESSPVSSSKQNLKKNRRESISIFENVNVVNSVMPVNINTESIISCVGWSLKVLIYILGSNTFVCTSLRRLLNTEDLKEEDISLSFFNSFETLMKMKEHKNVFLIVRNLLKASTISKKNILPDGFLNMIYKRMIKYTLIQKEMPKSDINYLINIIRTSKNPETFIEILETDLKTDNQKLNYWILCEIYYGLIGDEPQLNAAKDKRKIHYYSMQLNKKNVSSQLTSITIGSIFNLNFISINHLMKNLTNKIIDVILLKRLADDFNWDLDDVLMTQIVTILSLQELDYEITYDIFGKEELNVKTNFEEIVTLCRPYILEMSNVELFAARLIEYLSQINYYFYEMYLCVLSILKLINKITPEMSIWNNILCFLKYKMVVKRKMPPGQMETDLWLKSKPEIGVLPKIAKYRFPFKPIVEEPLKTMLDDEVTISNCVRWFPLIQFHAMLPSKNGAPNDIFQQQDYFCMAAVKNSINDYKKGCHDTDIWHLKPTNNAFLQSVLQLVKHMTDKQRVLFCLYFLMNGAPNGADYVEAATECYKYTVKYQTELAENPKTNEILMKINRKYPISKTQHLLYLYGLGEEKLFQYLETPKELIIALYNHEAILQPYKPDINNIVQEIAKFNNIDYQKIQFNLLQKWLSFSLTDSCDIDFEETFYEDLNTTVTTEDLNSEYVSRAYFILNSWERDHAKQFLISNIFTESRSRSNTQNQLYLIECLSKFTDEDTSNDLNIANKADYVAIKCIHLLKQIGFNYSKTKFIECDKLKLLKQIWLSHNTDWKGLKVLSYICLGYDICIPTIWNGVLKQMIVLNMISELTFLVKILSTKSAVLHIDGLIMAWELVIKSIFKSVNKTRTIEQETKLGKAFVLLQSCPVAAKLNIKRIAEMCIQIKRPHMAAVLISFADSDDRHDIVKMIKLHSTDTLKRDIMDLEELGVIPSIINYAINVFDIL